MNEEEKKAIEYFKRRIANKKTAYTSIYFKIEKLELLLNLIDKQNKVIDEMIKWIDEHEDPFEECHEINISCADVSCRECIKQYFIRKVNGDKNGI